MEKRLQKEKSRLDPAFGLTEEIPVPQTSDHHLRWRVVIPACTVILTFARNYPFVCPLVRLEGPAIFKTVTVCHSPAGEMCLSDFLPEWSASLTVNYILGKVQELLTK